MTVRIPPQTSTMPAASRLAAKAAAELKVKSAGVEANNPALQALVIATVERTVAQDDFVKQGTLSGADLAGLKVKVASATARALKGLAVHGAAEKAATGLRHGERIRAQQAKVIAQISEVAPPGPVRIDPKALAADLASVFESGARIGSLLAHDLWYADALPRTVQGSKSDDLGVDLGGGATARARPFMAPSAVILESGDPKLIATMEGLNVAGVKAALLGAVDAAGGTFARGATGADHFAAAQALASPLAGAPPSGALGPQTRVFLQKLGAEIVEADKAFARNVEPDWQALPLAHAALKGSHQRWLQLLSYAPGDAQKVDFDALAFGDKKNTVSSVIAAVFGAMKAGGMIPDDLAFGVPVYIDRAVGGPASVSVRLESLSEKPAVVLRDTRGGDDGRWVLRVDGAASKPVALGAGDGAKAAAAFLSPGSTVEVVDTTTGVARGFTVPPGVFATVDPAASKAASLQRLDALEKSLSGPAEKVGGRRAEVAAEARQLLKTLAPDHTVQDALALAARLPKLLAAVPLAVLGGDAAEIVFAGAGGKASRLMVNKDNAGAVLKDVKGLDEQTRADSVELRRAVLARSGGTLPTSDTYTFATDVPRHQKWDYLDPLKHWTGERRGLHETLFARAMAEATGLNDVISRPGQKPTVIAMRGNTAVGKTRTLTTVDSLKQGADFLKKHPTAAINPDPIKAEIASVEKQNGVNVGSHQVHEEGSAISWRLMQSLQKAAISMIVDRRLGAPNDVADLIASAEANGKNVELIDVEAPLAFSLMGVLMREPGGVDPIVPFSAIAHGFAEVREGRLRVLERVMESEAVTRYDLFATTPDGAKVCVARKRGTELEIVDQDRFNSAVGDPHAEVEALRTRVIDDRTIQELTASLPGGFAQAAQDALSRHKGLTFERALEVHGGG